MLTENVADECYENDDIKERVQIPLSSWFNVCLRSLREGWGFETC